jgi:5-deoxy-glucuronate isomerase
MSGFQVYRRAQGPGPELEVGRPRELPGRAVGKASAISRAARGRDRRAQERVRGAGLVGLSAVGTGCQLKALTDIEVGICTAPGRPRSFLRASFRPRRSGSRSAARAPTGACLQHPAGYRVGREPAGGRGGDAGGNWSSYPPHKHDRDALPEESFLEETYYHRLNPPQGFAFQRVYTDDRSIDETMASRTATA